MTGFEVYKMYLALKQHFTRDNYDYVKYRGQVRANETSFEQRRDRYFFKKIAAKYKDHDILNYFVANFVLDPKGYIKSFNDGNYETWRAKNDSLSYKLKQDVHTLLDHYSSPYQDKFDKIFRIEDGQHPIILKYYLAGDISLETLVIFEKCLGYVNGFDSKLTDPIWKDVRTRIVKYLPFLRADEKKYRELILTEIRTKL